MSRKLESIRILSFIIHGMIGIELLTIPINVVRYAKNDAWLSPIVIGAIVLLNIEQGYYYFKNYPGMNFAEINEAVFGKVIGKILNLVGMLYNIFINGVTLRVFAESISLFLLESTPSYVIMIVFLIALYYCSILDFESLSIVYDILLPIVLFSIIMLSIISFSAVTPYNLYPPLYGGAVPIIKGALSTVNPGGAAFIFAFILPMFAKPLETKKFVRWGVVISIAIYSLIIVLCVMVFGAEEINHMVFPTLTLSKAIQLENQVFERTESLFMAAWIPNTLTTVIVYFLISSISAKAFFNTKKDKLVKLAQLPFILFIALLPGNKPEIFKMLEWANIGLLFLIFGNLPLMTLTVFIKKGRGKK